MDWSSVFLSGILGGIGGGLCALLIELIPGLRGTKAPRYAGVIGAVLGLSLTPMVRPALARYMGTGAVPKMSASESAEFEAALKARGIKSGPEAKAFGAQMAAVGLPLLDDDRLIRRRQLLTRMLSPDDDRKCAALIRGDLSALSSGLDRLTSAEREAWGELSKEAALRGIRQGSASAHPSDSGLETMVKIYVAGSTADDQRRFGAIAMHLEAATDAEVCWFGRFLGTRADQGRRDAVASVERALVTQ